MARRAATSAGSAVRPQVSFVCAQAAAYAHHDAPFGGCHDIGSRSDFDRRVAAETATRVAGLSRSLA